MKKVITIACLVWTLVTVPAYSKNINFSVSDTDTKIVENDVEDAEQWVKDAWLGKLMNCRNRLIQAEVERSLKEGSPLPAGEDAIIDKYFSRSDYKNRKQRDADAKKNSDKTDR